MDHMCEHCQSSEGCRDGCPAHPNQPGDMIEFERGVAWGQENLGAPAPVGSTLSFQLGVANANVRQDEEGDEDDGADDYNTSEYGQGPLGPSARSAQEEIG